MNGLKFVVGTSSEAFSAAASALAAAFASTPELVASPFAVITASTATAVFVGKVTASTAFATSSSTAAATATAVSSTFEATFLVGAASTATSTAATRLEAGAWFGFIHSKRAALEVAAVGT